MCARQVMARRHGIVQCALTQPSGHADVHGQVSPVCLFVLGTTCDRNHTDAASSVSSETAPLHTRTLGRDTGINTAGKCACTVRRLHAAGQSDMIEEVVSTVLRERRIQDGKLRAKLAEAKHPANVAGAAARNCPICSAGIGSVKLPGMPEEQLPDATYVLKVRGRSRHSLLQLPVVHMSLQIYLHHACCRFRQTPV
jgi:hypothetical protein